MIAKKKKRAQNTSSEQYELYVKCLENDYFRTNTPNPAFGQNFLERKWRELTSQLNSTGEGPQLPVDEWKKRFSDWKYSIRSKNRKIKNKNSDLKLTPIEEKAISLWDKKVKLAPTYAINYNGLRSEENNAPNTFGENVVSCYCQHDCQSAEHAYFPTEEEEDYHLDTSVDEAIDNPDLDDAPEVKPLCVLTEPPLTEQDEDLQNTETVNDSSKELIEVLKHFATEYLDVKNKEQKIEELKLKFEIAKYKFQNPEFEFDF